MPEFQKGGIVSREIKRGRELEVITIKMDGYPSKNNKPCMHWNWMLYPPPALNKLVPIVPVSAKKKSSE